MNNYNNEEKHNEEKQKNKKFVLESEELHHKVFLLESNNAILSARLTLLKDSCKDIEHLLKIKNINIKEINEIFNYINEI